MKKTTALLFLLIFSACRNGKNVPDVSNIHVTASIERFDKAFFTIDSNNIVSGLQQLNHQFPYFTYDFIANILGAGPLSDTNKTAFIASRQFLTSYLPVKDSIELKFGDMKWSHKKLQSGLQFVKYYFPSYSLPPKVVSYIGPFD